MAALGIGQKVAPTLAGPAGASAMTGASLKRQPVCRAREAAALHGVAPIKASARKAKPGALGSNQRAKSANR